MVKKAARKRKLVDGIYYSARGIPLTRNGGWETESEHMSKIRSALRNLSRFWKPAMEALELASRPYTGTNKKIKKEYRCVNCSLWYTKAKVEINHIVACGSLKCYADVPQFLKRLFCKSSADYEILCKGCHLKETKRQKEGVP